MLISGRCYEKESVDRCFSMLEQMREKNLGLCCSVLYCMTVCVCSVQYQGSMKYAWSMFEPSPTGQLQGPLSPHELTWTLPHTRIHTHIWCGTLALHWWMPVLQIAQQPQESDTVWMRTNEESMWKGGVRKKKRGRWECCGQRWRQEEWWKWGERVKKLEWKTAVPLQHYSQNISVSNWS